MFGLFRKAKGSEIVDDNPLARVTPVWKLARAQILSKRYAGVDAYHVTEGGRLLVARGEECLYAIFTGVEDYWKIVSADPRCDYVSAEAIEKLKGGDREREITCIQNHCGETYLDTVGFPGNLYHSYLAMRTTVQHLLDEVEEKSKGRRERGGDDC